MKIVPFSEWRKLFIPSTTMPSVCQLKSEDYTHKYIMKMAKAFNFLILELSIH